MRNQHAVCTIYTIEFGHTSTDLCVYTNRRNKCKIVPENYICCNRQPDPNVDSALKKR